MQKNNEIGKFEIDNDLCDLPGPHDRPKNLNFMQNQKLIEKGPFQPKLKSYPSNIAIPSNKQCRFAYGWFKELPHLEYSVKADTVSYFVCCLFPIGPDRDKSDNACKKELMFVTK